MLTPKTAKAYAVLSIVMTKVDLSECTIEAYMNGREQGFVLSKKNGNLNAAFAESRTSDSIVVYVGPSTDFSLQGNVPNDKIWKSRRLFSYKDFIPAADFVIESLGLEQ